MSDYIAGFIQCLLLQGWKILGICPSLWAWNKNPKITVITTLKSKATHIPAKDSGGQAYGFPGATYLSGCIDLGYMVC